MRWEPPWWWCWGVWEGIDRGLEQEEFMTGS